MNRAVAALRRDRPRRPFVVWSVRLLALLAGVSWIAGRFDLAGFFEPRRRANLDRFLAELQPWPLRQGEEGATWLGWARDLWHGGGAEAAASTLAISVAASERPCRVRLRFANPYAYRAAQLLGAFDRLVCTAMTARLTMFSEAISSKWDC